MSGASFEVRHLDGDAFAIDVGGHEVIVDQPVFAGGADRGPTPTDLFVASLAACAGFFAWRFLRRHVPAETRLAVRCSFEMSDTRPARVTRIDLAVEVGAELGDDLRTALVRSVEQCTVHNSIRDTPQVGVSVSQPISVAAG